MFYILWAVFNGAFAPFQTGLNTITRKKVDDLYMVTVINYLVGIVMLGALILVMEKGIRFPLDELSRQPWWVYVGGTIGILFVVGNMVLLPKIGAVQPVILNFLGQVLMGLLIDGFGLFGYPSKTIGVWRILGTLLTAAGVFLATWSKEEQKTEQKKENVLPYQLLGLLIGAALACQTAINGRLGLAAGSPVKAALISFFVGLALAVVILLFRHPAKGFYKKDTRIPFYGWLGGVIGAVNVVSNAWLAPVLGTGVAVVATQAGGVGGSLLVDALGLFGVEARRISWIRLAGLGMMLLGAVAIYLL